MSIQKRRNSLLKSSISIDSIRKSIDKFRQGIVKSNSTASDIVKTTNSNNVFSRKLISKINSALQRIKDGTYGFCEETGEPIGLKRLMARPVATLSIEAQERHERDEKIFIDD